MDSHVSSTRLDRYRSREDAPLLPALFVAASAESMESEEVGRIITLGERLVIGRKKADEDTPSWIVKDGLISKRHCTITKRDDDYEISDLGSSNGTIVDGTPVKASPVRLREGAVIFIGGHIAVFRMVTQAELEHIAVDRERPLGPVATVSPVLAAVCAKMRKLARTTREMLITGETGVGKEVYARAVHVLSRRRGPFVPINCAALPRELIESELFGYEKGAHSQAVVAKRGLVEEAEEGTLFLDEIGEMPPDLQSKLLRFLQDRQVIPLGATKPRRVDVRVIAATSRTNSPTSPTGVGLRQDLVMRLGAEPIRLPPLRQRIEDLGLLIRHLLLPNTWKFEPVALQALALHRWPGNVRELEKILRDAELLADEETINLESLPSTLASIPDRLRVSNGSNGSRQAPTADEIEAALEKANGVVGKAAELLGRQRALVYRWCNRFGIDPERFRKK